MSTLRDISPSLSMPPIASSLPSAATSERARRSNGGFAIACQVAPSFDRSSDQAVSAHTCRSPASSQPPTTYRVSSMIAASCDERASGSGANASQRRVSGSKRATSATECRSSFSPAAFFADSPPVRIGRPRCTTSGSPCSAGPDGSASHVDRSRRFRRRNAPVTLSRECACTSPTCPP
jgi:hypothetical protein